MEKSILVTGSNGLVGQQVVKGLLEKGYNVVGLSIEKESKQQHERYRYISIDLTRSKEVERVFSSNKFSHVVHLAAIAHVIRGMKMSWSRYYRINTLVSRQIFECASNAQIPVFFASTVDVYGITKGNVTPETARNPIGEYAKSKFEAEKALTKICANSPYAIVRFAPIYFDNNSVDKRKRYYLKYPKISYRIGKGISYEFLNVNGAVQTIVSWVMSPNKQTIGNVYDESPINTRDAIAQEQANGRANWVIIVPMWLLKCIRFGINAIFGKESYKAYMIAKLITPVAFERDSNGLQGT